MVLGITLTSCAIGPNHEHPKVNIPKQWSTVSYQKNVSQQWWTNYGDEILTKLVDQSLESNLDLSIAVEKVKEARAGYDAQITSWLPTIGIETSAQRDRNSFPLLGLKKPYETWRAGGNASWEIDIFGGNRRLIEAAEAKAIAAEWGLVAAHQLIISEVVKTYLEYKMFDQLAQLTRNTQKSQDETARLVDLKLKAGGASEFDDHRAKAQALSTSADAPRFAAAKEQTRQKLMVLLGEKADLSGLDSRTLDLGNLTLDVDTPLEVIRNRPDIIIAEQELAAATFMTGVAISQMYPKISIQGFLGQMSTLQSTLNASENKSFSILGGIYLPLFSFGRLQKQVDAADARQQQALLVYKKTVLTVMAEIESLLSAFENEKIRFEKLDQAVKSSRRAAEIARKQYHEGLISLFETLEVERIYFALQLQLAESVTNFGIVYANLQKAMGRGGPSVKVSS